MRAADRARLAEKVVQQQRTPLVLNPTKGLSTLAEYDDTDIRDTRRPTNRNRLVPGLVALVLSAVVNFLIVHAAIDYDKTIGSPPPPPPPSPPEPPPPVMGAGGELELPPPEQPTARAKRASNTHL